MRSAIAGVLVALMSTEAVAQSMAVTDDRQAEADRLAESGRRRISGGAALIAFGVLGWAASTAGTVLTIVGYVQDSRGKCDLGACDTLNTTGRWLGIGGTIVEIGGLAGGITLVVTGVRRKRQAQRLRQAPLPPAAP
ncbi:MAG: hypothetical protein JWN44_4608 [Myxococcales bacterium]|nr:hypothetical protein [Myxococcales bacterium]